MSKFNIIGIVLCLAGLVMVVFQAVSSMMTVGEIVWKSISIIDIVNAEYLEWIDGISWHIIQNSIKYIVSAPIYLLLLCVGGVTLVVGGLTQK